MEQQPYSPFGNQSQQNQDNIPPSPTSDSGVEARTMQSDMESVRQSGGEAPQSQIVNAPEIHQDAPVQEAPSPTPSPIIEPVPIASETTPPPSGNSFNVKTLLLVIGSFVLAAAIGYGVYILVASLDSKSFTPAPALNDFPAVVPEEAKETDAGETPTQSDALSIAPLVHTTLISFTRVEPVSLNDFTFASLKAGVVSSSKEKLVAGSTKELVFQDAAGNYLETDVFLRAFLPSVESLAIHFNRDPTVWIYSDRVGGMKFGAALVLREEAPFPAVSSLAANSIEGAVEEIKNLFVASVVVPASAEFKDGQVEGTAVRFLPFQTSSGNVFEYGWTKVNGKDVMIMTSSYNQMVDVLRKAVQ